MMQPEDCVLFHPKADINRVQRSETSPFANMICWADDDALNT